MLKSSGGASNFDTALVQEEVEVATIFRYLTYLVQTHVLKIVRSISTAIVLY